MGTDINSDPPTLLISALFGAVFITLYSQPFTQNRHLDYRGEGMSRWSCGNLRKLEIGCEPEGQYEGKLLGYKKEIIKCSSTGMSLVREVRLS